MDKDTIIGFSCYECGAESLPGFPAYRCPCGGNLKVEYDFRRLRRMFVRPSLEALHTAGHFAYLPLLPVTEAGAAAFSLTVGGSRLVSSPHLAADLGLGQLYFKDDTGLPSASFKDRASSVLLAMAAERGVTAVSTASTGNAGCSMACLCADAGLEAIVFVPRTAPAAKVAQLLFYGARVVQVEGSYDDAFDLCWAISEKRGWLNRSTGWNPFTREGKKTVSFEIAHQLGWEVPDVVFVPVGDGNIISGTWKGFVELHRCGLVARTPKVVAVQSTLSNAISLAVGRVRAGAAPADAIQPVAATTRADSISVDLPRDGVAAVSAVVDSGGDAVEVTDEEIMAAVSRLAARTGLFAEPAGATSYAGMLKWLEGRTGAGHLSAVCLVTGSGLKDPSAASSLLAPPLVVPPDVAEAERILNAKPSAP